MDLNEISIFIKVVQNGSFTKTAKNLGMPNSTVSHKIHSLEHRLGVTLIQRTTRKLHITPAGEAYYKRCMAALEEIQGAEGEILAQQTEVQGTLKVTAPVELGVSLLSDILSHYLERYPKVKVDTLLTDRVVDLLGEGVDLAIRAGPLEDSSLVARKIGAVHFALFASPKYLKLNGVPQHPKELDRHQSIHFSPFGTEHWTLSNGKQTLRVPAPSRISVNDLQLARDLALKAEGIALLPSYYIRREIETNRLVPLLEEWRGEKSPVHFVYPSQSFLAEKVRAFIEFAHPRMQKALEN